MDINDEKGKNHADYVELMILYFIWVLGAPYYQGGYIGWIDEMQIVKIYLQTKNPRKIGHIRVFDRIPESLAGHA